MNAIETALCAVIQRHQVGPAVLPEHRLREDVGLDSLDLGEMVLLIEDEFGVRLEADQVKGCQTVRDLAEVIQTGRQLQEKTEITEKARTASSSVNSVSSCSKS